jgi:hypothetical protein
MRWRRGDVVLRREVLNDGRAWCVVPVRVVEDRPDLLVTYLPAGAPFEFPPGDWPTADGRHPWHGRTGWAGHGALMLQRPGESYAVWHFWTGPERDFAWWYLNLQEPFRRTADGYDTQDLELDLVVLPDGSWSFKDWDLVDQRVAEGRFTPDQAAAIRAEGVRLGEMVEAGADGRGAGGGRPGWWDPAWAAWSPEPGWDAP